MNSDPKPKTALIICEGKTDAYLIGHLMTAACGFTACGDAIRRRYSHFDKTHRVEVFARAGNVGYSPIIQNEGCNFAKNLETIYKEIANTSNPNGITKILVIADRDSLSIEHHCEKIETQIRKAGFHLNDEKSIKVAEFTELLIPLQDRSPPGDPIKVQIMLYLLPEDRDGALETFVLNSLDEPVVAGARKFVTAELLDGYFKKETPAAKQRLTEKAALGSTLAVLSPNHIFDDINKKLQTVRWDLSKMESLKLILNSLF